MLSVHGPDMETAGQVKMDGIPFASIKGPNLGSVQQGTCQGEVPVGQEQDLRALSIQSMPKHMKA